MASIKDFEKGDKVATGYGHTKVTGTVSKVGRKYVTIALDTPVVGGDSRKLFDFRVNSEMICMPATLRKVGDA
jgi:hypothetical protein